MKSPINKWLGMVLTTEIGLLFLFQSQAAYEQNLFTGYMYVGLFLVTIIIAFLIYRANKLGWFLGGVLSASLMVFLLWKFLVTYQGLRLDEWFNPFEVTTFLLNSAFLVLVGFRWRRSQDDSIGIPVPVSFKKEFVFGLLGISFMAITILPGYQFADMIKTLASDPGHKHIGSVKAVCSTPVTSLATLEDTYGVQVALVAATAMDSIVDVRLKIIDPDKAHNLFKDQAALLVDQKSLILAPHLHTHYKLKAGKLFLMFFPTQKMIHSGSQVSLVFGGVRIEPVTVR